MDLLDEPVSPASERFELQAHALTESLAARAGAAEGPPRSSTDPRWMELLLAELARCQIEFFAAASPARAFDGLLSTVLQLSQSALGFIGEVMSEEGFPFLEVVAFRDSSERYEARGASVEHPRVGTRLCNLNSLVGCVLLTGEMIISNDPPRDPRSGKEVGLPDMTSFLGIPLSIGEELIGVVGIANREGGYEQRLYTRLEAFRITTATLIREMRQRRERQIALAALAASERKLSMVLEEQVRQAEGLREAKEALEKEQWRLANIIDGTNIGTWEWNVQTGETRFNERWAAIVGFALHELKPVSIETWVRLVHSDDAEKSQAALERHFSGEADYFDVEVRMAHRDGREVWVHDRGKVFSWSESGKPLMMFGTRQDITATKEEQAAIEHLATHDPLTNLPTARVSDDRLKMAIERARRDRTCSAVLFLDLDGFKKVNDDFGHQMGDQLLVLVAERLTGALRAVDTVARIGGDEFLLICEGVDGREDAAGIAEKVLDMVRRPIDLGGNHPEVRFSIGIAMIPDDGLEPATLVRAADAAMYSVKHSGKDGFAFFVSGRDLRPR